MARDTLDRERNLNNIIDRLVWLEERVRRLEERLGAAGESGAAVGVLVPEMDSDHVWSLVVEDKDDGWYVLRMSRAR